MLGRATKGELWLFGLAVLFLSGAPSSLYVKLFAFAPPAPEALLLGPVLVLMTANMVVRLPATITGAFTVWSWLALAALACASFLWSVSAGDTLREGAVLLVSVLYLGMVAGIADWEDLLETLWRVCRALIVLSFALFVFIPSIGKMAEIYPGALSGPWFEKNAMGQFFLWASLVNYALLMVRPGRLVPALLWTGACAAGIALTESTTALLAFAAATGVVLLVAPLRRGFVISIPALLVIVLLGGPLAVLLGGEGAALVEAVGKSGTLTGRVPIWQALIDFSLDDRPWLGHGYAAFWANEYEYTSRALVYDLVKYRVPHSHNTLIEARLDLGWLGAGLWLFAFAQLLGMSLLRLRGSQGAYLALPVCAGLALVATVEISPFSVANLGGMLFVLSLAKMTRAPSRADRRSGAWGFVKAMAARDDNGTGYGPAFPVVRA